MFTNLRIGWKKSGKATKQASAACSRQRGHRRSLTLEVLEDRTLLSVSLVGVPQWFENGPGPIRDPDNDYHLPGGIQVGKLSQVAVDPRNPNHLAVPTANPGIWSTTPSSTEE